MLYLGGTEMADCSLRYDCTVTDIGSQGYMQVPRRKNSTVKELLIMKRKSCSYADHGGEQQFEYAKYPTVAADMGPHMLSPHAHECPPTAAQPPPAYSASGHCKTEPTQSPPILINVAPCAGVKVTLFHWQVQQAGQRVGDISPELLSKQDEDGDTYLHIAVAQGKRALAYVLAEKMSKWGLLDMREHNGQTALHIASAADQHLIVRDLLVHGAQIDACDTWGRSPFHVCAEKGHALILQTIWKSFCEIGEPLDVDIFSYDGFTPLHTAVLSHNKIVRELSCLASPGSEVGLLHRKGLFVDCIQTLLRMGASLTAKDSRSGRNCLHMASEEANIELLQIFLDQPQSLHIVNIKAFSGNTALHIVSGLQNRKCQVEAVKLLMRKGADPGTKNYENELPCNLVPEGPLGEKVRQILKGKRVYF